MMSFEDVLISSFFYTICPPEDVLLLVSSQIAHMRYFKCIIPDSTPALLAIIPLIRIRVEIHYGFTIVEIQCIIMILTNGLL